jgi:hypothetical protein
MLATMLARAPGFVTGRGGAYRSLRYFGLFIFFALNCAHAVAHPVRYTMTIPAATVQLGTASFDSVTVKLTFIGDDANVVLGSIPNGFGGTLSFAANYKGVSSVALFNGSTQVAAATFAANQLAVSSDFSNGGFGFGYMPSGVFDVTTFQPLYPGGISPNPTPANFTPTVSFGYDLTLWATPSSRTEIATVNSCYGFNGSIFGEICGAPVPLATDQGSFTIEQISPFAFEIGEFSADWYSPGLLYNDFPANDVLPTSNSGMTTPSFDHTTTLLADGTLFITGGLSTSDVALTRAERYTPCTQGYVGECLSVWTAGGDMQHARYLHSATLLANGKVLVAGGLPASASSSVELYDASTGTWSAGPALLHARSGHTATRLLNGSVLVVGGDGGSGTAEIYDPVLGAWSATGSCPVDPGVEGTSTLLGNGKVLTIGPTGAALYDPASNLWTALPNIPAGRMGHTATLLRNGLVLVAGGRSISPTNAHADTALFNPLTSTWTIIPGGPFGSHATANLLPDGTVLVIGGLDYANNPAVPATDPFLHFFSPADNAWHATSGYFYLGAPLSAFGLAYHTATMLPSGRILLVGGTSDGTAAGVQGNPVAIEVAASFLFSAGSLTMPRESLTATMLPSGRILAVGGNNGASSNVAELYDPTTDTWSPTGNLTDARSHHTANLLPDGNVLVTGGDAAPSTQLASIEVYDPSAGAWLPGAPMSTPRSGHTATLLANGGILVAGGFNSVSGILASVEVYDSTNDTWQTLPPLMVPRQGHTANLLADGRVIVTGGTSTAGPVSSIEIYDPATHAWTSTVSLYNARTGHSATLLPSGNLFIAGGVDASSACVPTPEVFQTANSFVFTTYQDAVCTPTATALPGGLVLLAGASDANGLPTRGAAFDPGIGLNFPIWTGVMPRTKHAAVRGSSGKVLLVGGESGPGVYLGTAAIASPRERSFPAGVQPMVTGFPSTMVIGAPVSIRGFNLTGIVEGSGGNPSQNSASNVPIVTLKSLSNDQEQVLDLDTTAPWSDTQVLTQPLGAFPVGFAELSVTANGIRSTAQIGSVKLPQSISFSAPSTLGAGSTVALTATATSGLTVTLATQTPTVCTVASGVLTAVSAGSCAIVAGQPGNSIYAAAPPVTAAIAITGTGHLSVTPSSIDFGRVPIHERSRPKHVSVRNSGTEIAAVGGISITGNFHFKSECTATLRPTKACTVTVRFVPRGRGPQVGTLSIGSQAQVALAGVGTRDD